MKHARDELASASNEPNKMRRSVPKTEEFEESRGTIGGVQDAFGIRGPSNLPLPPPQFGQIPHPNLLPSLSATLPPIGSPNLRSSGGAIEGWRGPPFPSAMVNQAPQAMGLQHPAQQMMTNGPPSPPQPKQQQPQQQQQASPYNNAPNNNNNLSNSSNNIANSNGGPPEQEQQGGGGQDRQKKHDNAIEFLDLVKAQFSRQPRVYNQFLDIMKDFKHQTIDTAGVIQRVTELFRGHKSLILGFNTFLPAEYKIEADSIPPEYLTPAPPPPPPVQTIPQQQQQPPQHAQQQQPSSSKQARAPPPPTVPANKKQHEFDHARDYVRKIKTRFSLQPEVYKAFLEILHTYAKEGHTIKDVYDQVANLFLNQQDLLDEFTQFLPDPIPAPAASTAPASSTPSTRPKQRGTRSTKTPSTKLNQLSPPQTPTLPAESDVGERTRRGLGRKAKDENAKPEGSEKTGATGQEELAFFNKVKAKLSPKLYSELLKCLNIFNQEIISRLELLTLARDILIKHPDLFERLRQILGVPETVGNQAGEYEDPKEKTKPMVASTAWSEIDFTTCKRYGPSYRALPKNYQVPICSGRTSLCDEVLNDTWVSVPVGREDFYFRNSRKNQYEEALFSCEDSRFELDLVIELNGSTMKAMEPIIKRINELSEEDKVNWKIDRNEFPLDSVLHIRSIERIYGDKGSEVVDGLYANPVVAAPIIIKRLKQKDQEWKKAQREWNKVWREINEKNYHKSLDHQSFYFKQIEKKSLSAKVLLAEIKQKHAEKLKEATYGQMGPSYHLIYKLPDASIFSDICELITFACEKSQLRFDKEKLENFMHNFVESFFRSTKSTTSDEAQKTDNENKEASEESKCKPLVTKMNDATGATTSSTTSSDRTSRLFLGNSHFYVFFRLYQILYDRMSKAKGFASQMKEKWANGAASSPPKEKANSEKSEKTERTPKEKYSAFIKALYGLVGGATDSSKYEDELRELFGMSTYVLFTMDKLVFTLCKQIQTITSEESSSKLISLFNYEDARTNGFIESIYFANATDILNEERCFRFEFELAPRAGELTIQLLDPQHQPKYMELSFNKEKWSKYMDNYVDQGDQPVRGNGNVVANDGAVAAGETSSTGPDPKKHHVFLTRNQKKNLGELNMDKLILVNGLECKICVSTYKLFYVEETEDYFYRKGSSVSRQKTRDRISEQRTSKSALKFHNWLNKTLGFESTNNIPTNSTNNTANNTQTVTEMNTE